MLIICIKIPPFNDEWRSLKILLTDLPIPAKIACLPSSIFTCTHWVSWQFNSVINRNVNSCDSNYYEGLILTKEARGWRFLLFWLAMGVKDNGLLLLHKVKVLLSENLVSSVLIHFELKADTTQNTFGLDAQSLRSFLWKTMKTDVIDF